jgi:hypothetical protein
VARNPARHLCRESAQIALDNGNTAHNSVITGLPKLRWINEWTFLSAFEGSCAAVRPDRENFA